MKRAAFSFAACLAALCLPAPSAQAIQLDPQGLIRADLLSRAMTALQAHRGEADVTHLVIVDYSRRSDQRRA